MIRFKTFVSSCTLFVVLFGLLYVLFPNQLFIQNKEDTFETKSSTVAMNSSSSMAPIMTPSSPYHHYNEPPKNVKHPTVRKTDLIYDTHRNTPPIVNEEYNTIFFLVAKAGSSEWIRFFLRLINDHTWCSNKNIHDTKKNGLKYLSDYTMEEARQMMIDPKWNKAIFVRHPKPRVLSAFLDKAVSKTDMFIEHYCDAYRRHGKDFEECLNNHENFEFFIKEIIPTLSLNVHWRTIYSRVDEKWWPYINYVGYMESLSDHAKTFLQSIHSNIDGISAWDKIGKSGWSDNERSCKNVVNATGEFLAQRDKIHTMNARQKMLEFYTPELEKIIEDYYWDDLNNQYFQFKPIKLFDNNNNNSLLFDKDDRI